ncbi:MAG: sugar phosphate isomerase/epimerase [Nitrospirota bacterium]|nr:sugar phosphate isomerase/epimerase [Nitrospirota bacterium]
MQARINVHVPFKRIFDHLDLIREKALDLEIYVSADDLDAGDHARFEHLAASLDYSPRVSIHAPFMDLSPGAIDPAIREVTVRRYRQAIESCTVLRPQIMVCHSGYDRWRFNGHRDIWRDGWRRTYDALSGLAEHAGIRIAIENIFDETPDPLASLMEKLPREQVGICFDTGHFNLFSSTSLSEWIGLLGHRIMATHLHDNFKQKDDHLPVGTATFDFPGYFGLLKAGEHLPLFTIETHDRTRIEESLANTRRIWEAA